MQPLAAVIFVFILHVNTVAQTTETIRVKAGYDIVETLSHKIFRYPVFTAGKIYFKDGNISSALLNFNFLVSEMQFIAPAGDTLTVSNEKTIRYITIESDSFYYDKDFLELVAGFEEVKLAARQRIKVAGIQKISGYDQPSAVSSISNYTTFYSGSRAFKLDLRQDVILTKETTYYLGDRFNRFFLATKRNIMNMYPKHEDTISGFLKSASINLNRERDLVKLAGFLTQF